MKLVERLDLFATPVMVYGKPECDAMNDAIARHVLEEAGTDEGLVRSNIGGWHSNSDLQERSEPYFVELDTFINDCFRDSYARIAAEFNDSAVSARWRCQGWAMLMGAGDYSMLHDHADADWSCVYYVDAGDAPTRERPMSGVLAFDDPRLGVNRNYPAQVFPPTFTLEAQTGMLVMFPSWLKHYVNPYFGSRPRVSVSYNIQFQAPDEGGE